ncbi:MAG: T9SS type A sorting domain-containing protein [Bacteroidia bacterium]|nr:T9SS type A sorting domain-containing protein [Bacteroidia bacterium]
MKKLFTLLLTILIFSATFAAIDGGVAKENPFVKEFAIYPNPSTGPLNLSLEMFDEGKPLQLKVFNLIGQQMDVKNLEPFVGRLDMRLDLSNYPKGIYMIEITNGKQSRTKRVSII